MYPKSNHPCPHRREDADTEEESMLGERNPPKAEGTPPRRGELEELWMDLVSWNERGTWSGEPESEF